jgi:hypothetical protein
MIALLFSDGNSRPRYFTPVIEIRIDCRSKQICLFSISELSSGNKGSDVRRQRLKMLQLQWGVQ